MSATQSTAVESKANPAVEHIDYTKALTPAQQRELQDTELWLDELEQIEVECLRHNYSRREHRAFANEFRD